MEEEEDLNPLLSHVCRNGTAKPLRDFTSKYPDFDLDSTLVDGHTPLTLACDAGNLDILKELLNNKVDVNLKNRFNFLPLQMAIFRANLPLVRELLAHPLIDLFRDFACDGCVALCYAWTLWRDKYRTRRNYVPMIRRDIVQEVLSKMSLYSYQFKCRNKFFLCNDLHNKQICSAQLLFIIVAAKRIKRIGRNSFVKLLSFDLLKILYQKLLLF